MIFTPNRIHQDIRAAARTQTGTVHQENLKAPSRLRRKRRRNDRMMPCQRVEVQAVEPEVVEVAQAPEFPRVKNSKKWSRSRRGSRPGRMQHRREVARTGQALREWRSETVQPTYDLWAAREKQRAEEKVSTTERAWREHRVLESQKAEPSKELIYLLTFADILEYGLSIILEAA